MTINIDYILRKTIGWCPLKDRMFVQVHESGKICNSNKDQANSGIANNVNLPLDMFDWRKFAIILALGFSAFILIFVNYLNRTAASYFGIILLYFTFIAFFNLSDKNKVSIDSEKLVIKTSFFESINILKHDITDIKTIDNVIYKYSWVNLVLIILILILGFFQVLSLHGQIIRSADMEDAVLHIANSMFMFFILISSFYRSNRRSRYPKTIRIDTATKNITLYPINESEFNILKGELEK
ncbi:MAG: hypothetical protein MPEBLZ_02947 [Candidatus Methanoperedens nitroreducens]|uniref:DUF1673 family protein n=1 Tax=Candidatus Methanoperedens nitratireducens TaxID=1392998 RepID=A0A0P7ZCU9_9EURY|nr:DUF1673 family protein [Candidatus Methanoperedens sp. BLZ2]KAB2944905.1 MAG: DUF1673 family protein [Candidatus Methanoperedens sp.]KPQ42489.1 MAG: hypothetical protein MPEBLZ_02947 [Candidatus Methanoperedens sp. BLZ1]MBZ0173781.1 DUF1673 family protein [Candidatus Methanoperedens nitroreducens]MCX9078282.1 DUF1673 family protein [Candidatus Methanoperedens sp.]